MWFGSMGLSFVQSTTCGSLAKAKPSKIFPTVSSPAIFMMLKAVKKPIVLTTSSLTDIYNIHVRIVKYVDRYLGPKINYSPFASNKIPFEMTFVSRFLRAPVNLVAIPKISKVLDRTHCVYPVPLDPLIS
jgi:hypothetical protein